MIIKKIVKTDWSGPQPIFVLVKPQMGENIGASARAMWNFGLEYLRLVAPRDGWPNTSADVMASGAGHVLDRVRVESTVANALADMNYCFATTARKRDLKRNMMSPKRAMRLVRRLVFNGNKVAVLFGAERSGLTNAEVVHADRLILIATNPAFSSLNLAQAVLLLAYEWRRSAHLDYSTVSKISTIDYATKIEVQKLLQRIESSLDAVGFFWPEEKMQSMRLALHDMMSRLHLTGTDVRRLHGIFKALTKHDLD